MEKLKNSKVLGIIKWVWIVAVFVAVVIYAVNHFGQVEEYFRTIHWVRFLIAMLLIVLGKLFTMQGARLSVTSEGAYISFWKFFSIFSLTQLGKYLPGGIWHFVGRFGTYRTEEMDTKKSLRAMITENIWLIGSAFLTGIIFFLLFNREILQQYGVSLTQVQALLIIVVLLILWCVGLLIVQRYAQSLEKFDFGLILKVSAIYMMAWFCFGVSYGLLFPEMGSALGLAIGGFALSWSIGYVVVFAPAGIGVRELALTFVFSGTAYAALSPVLASVHRILWVLGELSLGLVVVIYDALKKKPDLNEPVEEAPEEVQANTETP